MSMNHDKDNFFEEINMRTKIACGCLAASLVVLLILGITLYTNRNGYQKKPNQSPSVVSTVSSEETEDIKLGESSLTSDDLDFWGMYDEEEAKEEETEEDKVKPPKDDSLSKNQASMNGISKNSISGDQISDNSISENSFNISSKDEEPKYKQLIESIPKNSFKKENFRKDGEKLQYNKSNGKSSVYGIDVSKYQGMIDWEQVKEAGVEFAMIRMGVRGYNSGKVVVDENFTKNIEGALSAGIDVGIYFYSQAVTKEEAVEEANYAVAAISNYTVNYPIVFYTEEIENDNARTNQLSVDNLTQCADYFCQTIQNYGYKPMICANKKQFATRLDLTKLTKYDWWLLDACDFSEFPYNYTMWQYSNGGKINGIPEDVNLNICFVDFKYR